MPLTQPTHLPQLTTIRPLRSFFRRRYLVRCWDCTLRLGPYDYDSQAHAAAQAASTAPCALDEVTTHDHF